VAANLLQVSAKINQTKSHRKFSRAKAQAFKNMETSDALWRSKIDSQLEACFLNHTKKLDLPADWNNESPQ